MATKNALSALSGFNARALTIRNLADPVSAQDLSTKNFASNAVNLTSGTITAARLPSFTGAVTSDSTGKTTLSSVTGATGSHGGEATIPSLTTDLHGRVTGVTATAIRTASTSQTGIVQLHDGVASTSTSLAATPNAVKTAYDLANAALPLSQKGANNGIAALNANGVLVASQVPEGPEERGRLLAVRIFTVANTGQTYVPTDGTKAILVMVIAGGGGGGGAGHASGTSAGGGGAAGSFSMSYLTSGFSGVLLTIGAGGAGGYGPNAGGSGVSGGNSSFGSLVTAAGGGGAFAGGQWSPIGIALPGGPPGPGTGQFVCTGGAGKYGLAMANNLLFSGRGAISCFSGQGGSGVVWSGVANDGIPAWAYGAGGGGAAVSNHPNYVTGGKGGDGVIIIHEYA